MDVASLLSENSENADEKRPLGAPAVIVRALEAFQEAMNPVVVDRGRRVTIIAGEASLEEDVIEWRFRVDGSGGQVHPVELTLASAEGSPEWSEARSPQLMATGVCTCHYYQVYGPCKHVAAAVRWLLDRLGRRSAGEAARWLREQLPDPAAAGREVLALLDEASAHAAEMSDGEDSAVERAGRVQWRIEPDATRLRGFTINPYLQKPRRGGRGWTKGRQLSAYNPWGQLEEISSPVEMGLIGLWHMAEEAYQEDPLYWRLLLQLRGLENVVWNDDPTRSLVIVEKNLRMRLVAQASYYQLQVWIDDIDLTTQTCPVAIGGPATGQRYLAAFDEERDRVLLARIATETLEAAVGKVLQHAPQPVRLDAEGAAQLTERSADLDLLLPVELPEALGGPEKPFEPHFCLLLSPAKPDGLDVRLRVTSGQGSRMLEPGLPPERVRTSDAEGPVQLVRNLAAETAQAEQLAGTLELAQLSYTGPYHWMAESDEAAVTLLDRIAALGDDAPEIRWPSGGQVRLFGEITPQSLRVRVDDGRDWFGLSGMVELEGVEVELARVLETLRAGRRFVPLGNRQFAKISDAFRKRLTDLADVTYLDHGRLRVADAAASLVEESLGEDIQVEAVPRWSQTLERIREVHSLQPEVPQALQADLREYQQEGYRWLARLSAWGVGGCLADDMGLGKTVQALGVLLDRAADGPALIVAPTSVGENWMRETARFAPSLRPHLYREHDREHLVQSAGPGDLVIVSYQLMQRDAERFASRPWHTFVLDEAQFIKNAQTKTAQAARRIPAGWRLALTGTPLENHLGELWSLFRAISPGLLGSWEHFRRHYADPIEREGDQGRKAALARFVQPFILRRTKDKVLRELPARTEVVRYAEMSEAERSRYEQARMAAISELAGGEESPQQKRFQVLAWLMRLRQLACHPRLVDQSWRRNSAKLELFLEIVDELRDGEHRALVFSQFVQHLQLVREALDARGIPYQYLDGATPARQRQQHVDAFQAGEGDLFLISLKAGGTGLNLTGADYVIHLDPWWNPAVEDQATDRAHRIGQTRPVTVYRLVAKETIEEQILALHADKRELVASVLDGTDRAGRLGTEEMIQMIRSGS